MDGSFPGEILAIGGHKRLNDITYSNQIIFYTRRGEFLHRIYIPQTVWKEFLKKSNYVNHFFFLDSTIICFMLGTWQW
jgi:hypothetical protein